MEKWTNKYQDLHPSLTSPLKSLKSFNYHLILHILFGKDQYRLTKLTNSIYVLLAYEYLATNNGGETCTSKKK